MSIERLLIVDDDEPTREGLAELLAGQGFPCAAVGTFTEAMRILRESPPALLITDIRLGAYNGLQLALRRPARTSAIVISGFRDCVLEAEAARSGAIYMRKPVNPRELIAMVRSRIESSDAASDPH